MTIEWKLVPVEPTEEMRDAGNVEVKNRGVLFSAWRAMLAAAPVPPSEQDRESKVNELVEFMDHLSGGLRHFAGAIIDAGWAKASPVPSAGGEVEVLAWRVLGYNFNTEAFALDYAKWAEDLEPVRYLVDLAHVTRLQAELCARAGQIASLAGERDAIKAELEQLKDGFYQKVTDEDLKKISDFVGDGDLPTKSFFMRPDAAYLANATMHMVRDVQAMRAERDALKAEVSTAKQREYDAQVRASILQSELTNAQELFSDMLRTFGTSLMSNPPQDPWRNARIGERITEFLANQSAPAARHAPQSSDVNEIPALQNEWVKP